MTSACPTRDDWRALLADERSTADRERMAEHLEKCTDCQRALEQLAGELSIPAGVAPTTDDAAQSGRSNQDALRGVISRLLANGARSSDGAQAHATDLPPGLLGPSSVPGGLGRIGKYEVLSIIGRGGLGVVMKGLDPQLNRIVAIKIPAPELAANAAVRKRFLREAQAAAAVRHDHIVTIHAVEESNGIPYLVMEYISGTSLQHIIDEQGALEFKKVLRIGMQTAAGLAAAHKQGIVHRDVKPANILLENGIQRVKLTDFGLARAVDDASITQSGMVAGTPQYMSPEQARGETIDARSDLFSLGAVLYAMCTGRPAFRADSTMAVLKRVCEDDPRPIEQINPEIPSWLVAIIERLMAKHPADRVQTAQEVADRLGTHLAHLQEPSVAHPPAPLPRLKTSRKPSSWARVFTNTAIVLAVLAFLAGFLFTSVERVSPEPPQAPVAPTFGGFGNGSALRPALTIDAPDALALSADFSAADDSLTVGSGSPDNTVYQWNSRSGEAKGTARDLSGSVRAIKYSPDGHWVMAAARDVLQRIQAPTMFKVNDPYKGLDSEIHCVAWSPDGYFVAAGNSTWNSSGSKPPEVAVWDADSRKLIWKKQLPRKGDKGGVTGIAYSKDGSELVVSHYGSGDVISVFKAADGQFIRSFGGPRNGDDPLVLVRQPGSDIFYTGHAGTRVVDGKIDDAEHAVINVWNIAGRLLKTFRGHRSGVAAIDFTPDGIYMISGSGGQFLDDKDRETPAVENQIRMWVASTEKLVHFDRRPQSVKCVRFSSDGRQLVTIDGGMKDRSDIQLWDVAEKMPSEVSEAMIAESAASGIPVGPANPSATDSPSDDDGGPALASKPLLMSHDVYSLRFSPDGSRLLAGMWGNTGLAEIIVRESRVVPQVHTRSKENWLWTGTDDRLQARYPFVTRAIYLPGDRIAATSEKGFFDILDLNPPPSIQPVRCGDEMIWQISASADGKWIAAGGDEGVVSVWHIDEGMKGKFQHSDLARCVAISPDGTRVVSGGADNATRSWSVTENREIQKLEGFEPSDIAFFADSRRVAIAGNDYRVYVWDCEDGKVIHRLGGHTHSVVTVAVSTDQRWIASGAMDNTVRIWNTATGKPVAKFGGHSMKITSVDFSPDGKWLASASLDKTVRMWAVPEPTASESADTSSDTETTPNSGSTDSAP